jgi:hypothetical protein
MNNRLLEMGVLAVAIALPSAATGARQLAPSGTLNPVNGLPVAGSSFGDGPFNGPEDLSLFDRCITRGLPGSMMPFIHGNSYQIVQAPGVVSIRYELIHETRVIPLDGRPHIGKGIRLEMGDARGRWRATRWSSRRPTSATEASTETRTRTRCA